MRRASNFDAKAIERELRANVRAIRPFGQVIQVWLGDMDFDALQDAFLPAKIPRTAMQFMIDGTPVLLFRTNAVEVDCLI